MNKWTNGEQISNNYSEQMIWQQQEKSLYDMTIFVFLSGVRI